jgi:phosphoribosylanthranilate isomerase
VAGLGADAIGVIGVASSARYLTPERRAALFAAVAAANPACLRVLVMADPGDDELPSLEASRGHGVVQLHGRESVARCAELRRRLDVSLWKAVRISSPDDLGPAHAYAAVVDALLLDAWVPDRLGGTGHRIPIEWLEGFAPAVPWWLAGGITAERVPEVLARLRPDGLDASSGVEVAPGEKDLTRVAELVAAVQACARS